MYVLFEDEATICSLKEPHGSDATGWERIDVGVDSCAATSCTAKDKLTQWPLLQATGVDSYTSASGETTKALGSRKVQAWFQNDTQAMVNMKVLDPLHKTLFAVSDLIKSCRVVFDL